MLTRPLPENELSKLREYAGQIINLLTKEQRQVIINYLEALQVDKIYASFGLDVHIPGEAAEHKKNYGYGLALESIATFISAPLKKPDELMVNQEEPDNIYTGPQVGYDVQEGEI